MVKPVSKLRAAMIAILVLLAWTPVIGADDRPDEFPGFDGVHDRTRGIGDDERDAYFQLLDYAARGDYKRQLAQAERNYVKFEKRFYDNQKLAVEKNPKQTRYRFSLYADLLKDPQAYRGQLLPLRGHVRRLEKMPLIDGDVDRGTAYQAYLFTDDSRTHPYIVVCREVPPGMPHGGDILEEVEVAGYFFKIYAYDAQDAVRIAPLLIAQRLEWFPRQPVTPLMSPFWIGLVAVSVLLILIVVLWRIAANDRRVRQDRLRKMADEDVTFSPPES